MTAWDEVRDLIDAEHVEKLAERLKRLDDAERRRIAGELPGHLRTVLERARRSDRERREAHREATGWLMPSPTRRDLLGGRALPLRLAGAGTMTPSALTAWLNRREFATSWFLEHDVDVLARMIASRPADVRAEIAVRLTHAVRNEADPGAVLALELLRCTGTEPPVHDPLLLAWVRQYIQASPQTQVERIAEDPLLDALIPRIFEVEGVGRLLRDDWFWPGMLPELAARGAVRRETLLGGCASRFLRGGSGPDLRFFVRLHDALDPAPAETAPWVVDYLRLLPSAPGPVATLALAQLRGRDLDADDVAEAAAALLCRPEVKLVRTGLSWLEETLRGGTADAPPPVSALATALSHPSPDIRERAARLALRYGDRLAPQDRETLAEASDLLPPRPGVPLPEGRGGASGRNTAPPASGPPPLPAPVPAGPLPAPPDTPEALVTGDLDGWQACERWLAGFVRLAGEKPEELRVLLPRWLDGDQPHLHGTQAWTSAEPWLTTTAWEFAHPRDERRSLSEAGMPTLAPGRRRLPKPGQVAPPHMFVLRRLAEILTALKAGALPPLLLATPTRANGHLDPDELVARIEACEAAGAEPLPADLQQALLRLPRAVDPAVAERAGRLRSEAGRTAARWMAAGGLPDPLVEVRWSSPEHGTGHSSGDREPPRDGARMRPTARVTAEPTGLALVDELLSGEPRPRGGIQDTCALLPWWPAVLPSHREVVAAYQISYLLNEWNGPSGHAYGPAVLVDPDAEGPAGEATGLALALLLLRGDPSRGITALLGLAARGDLPAAELGDHLAELIEHAGFEPRPLVAALSEAARQGAYREVWAVLTRLLRVLMPRPGERAKIAHIEAVTLAADVAGWTAARGEPSTAALVAGYAGQKGGSRFLQECRRLCDLLSLP
ncbi:hypothetical protein HS041_11815 [Planomonospora sp. ID67723]|uniref:DUF7824 domain-containing protein n=1 Tax=Planomonospora sp. ID67723 TaxID=2738134 RepID=UPI0018C43C7D|nr:DUF6493 family protein [Planomonospora sp. ID67723]MBG0828453.1 hypothetical protein [Planomonospora sp. ID67723]